MTSAEMAEADFGQIKYEVYKIMARHGFAGELNPCVSEVVDLVWKRGVLDATKAAARVYRNTSQEPHTNE